MTVTEWPTVDQDNRGWFDAALTAEETTVDTEQTPAEQTASLLVAVATHLRQNPHLPAVNISRGGDLQIAHRSGEGWTDGDAIIAWARSLPDAKITAKRYDNGVSSTGQDVPIDLVATLDGVQVRVWDAFDAGDVLGLEPGASRELSFGELHDALSST